MMKSSKAGDTGLRRLPAEQVRNEISGSVVFRSLHQVSRLLPSI